MDATKLLTARKLIRALSELNPDNDPHEILDKSWADKCKLFLERSNLSDNPLTLAEWQTLRSKAELHPALDRAHAALVDSDDEVTFLYVLRDMLVFGAGSAGVVISVIGTVIDA